MSQRAKSSGIEWAEATTVSAAEAKRLMKLEDGTECVPCPPNRAQGRYKNLKSTYMDSFQGDFEPAHRIARKLHVLEPRPFVGTTTHQDDYKFHGMPRKREPSKLARMDNGILEKNLPFEGVTTHQHDFRKWNSAPPKLMKKEHARDNQPDERDFHTEFSSQFGPKRCNPRKSNAPTEQRARPLPFSGSTSYTDDFKRWGAVEPAQSVMKSRSYRPRPEDRDFLTECRGEYTEKPFDVAPARKSGICPPGWCRPNEIDNSVF